MFCDHSPTLARRGKRSSIISCGYRILYSFDVYQVSVDRQVKSRVAILCILYSGTKIGNGCQNNDISIDTSDEPVFSRFESWSLWEGIICKSLTNVIINMLVLSYHNCTLYLYTHILVFHIVWSADKSSISLSRERCRRW